MAEPLQSPDLPPEKPAEEGGKSKGWIQDFADRSTGLPRQEPLRTSQDGGDKSLWRLAGFGIQFAGTVGLFAFMGYELDRKMGWSPWGVVSLSMIAVIGNLYLLIKEVVMEPKAPKKKRE